MDTEKKKPATLFRTVIGSYLYGTANENSDVDIKSVSLPTLAGLLTCRAQLSPVRCEYMLNEKKQDCEDIPLQTFIKFAVQNQTVALDMLFSPERFWLEDGGRPMEDAGKFDFWREAVLPIRHKFVSKCCINFVSYAVGQALKYSVKGDKLNRLVRISQELEKLPLEKTVGEARLLYPDAFAEVSYDEKMKLAEACGVKIPAGAAVKTMLETLRARINRYGLRTRTAAEGNGRDLKALSHAARAIYEAEELADTGMIVFPLRKAEELKRIKYGLLDEKELVSLPDKILENARAAEEKIKASKLPDKVDPAIFDDVIFAAYRKYGEPERDRAPYIETDREPAPAVDYGGQPGAEM